MRTCKHCGRKYDAAKESSVWCQKNPNRGRGAHRLPKRIVRLAVLTGYNRPSAGG